MKNKLLKTIFMTMLCCSIVVSNISLIIINAEEENILSNENIEDIEVEPNENEENIDDEIIEFSTPVWDEIQDRELIYSGKPVNIQEPTYTIGSTNGNKADKIYYRYVSKDGSYDSEIAPIDAGEYTVTIEAYIDNDTENFYKDSANITIKKAILTVSADNQTIKQNESLPIATYSINGFVNDESEDVFTSNTLKAIYKNEDTSKEGKYPINIIGEIEANNYDYIFIDGVLDIVKQEEMIDTDEEKYKTYDKISDEYSKKDEELNIEENPKTGENINILIYSAMALFSGCSILFMGGKDSW